eukprot:125695-Rhodomonas_salina.3
MPLPVYGCSVLTWAMLLPGTYDLRAERPRFEGTEQCWYQCAIGLRAWYAKFGTDERCGGTKDAK